MVHIFITRYNKNRTQCNLDNIIYNLLQANVNINFWIRSIDVYWGILNTLVAATVFDDEIAVTQIFNIVNSKINPTAPLFYLNNFVKNKAYQISSPYPICLHITSPNHQHQSIIS